jgi:DNA-binding response OmpR family regulator
MKKLKVLVADSTPFLRDTIKAYIREKYTSCDISEANEGEKARSLLEFKRFDLVFCQYDLPKESGDQLLYNARQLKHTQKTAFVLLISDADEELQKRLLSLGALGVLVKPFNREQLMKYVHAYCIKAGYVTAAQVKRPGPIGQLSQPSESLDALTLAPSAKNTPTESAATASSAPTTPAVTKGVLKVDGADVECLVKSQTSTSIQVIVKATGLVPTLRDEVDIVVKNTAKTAVVVGLSMQKYSPRAEFIVVQLAT